MPSCVVVTPAAITVLAPTDIGAAQLGQALVLIPDPGTANNPVVHVAAVGQGQTPITILRTVSDQGGGGLSPVVSLGTSTTTGQACGSQQDCTNGGNCVSGSCLNTVGGFQAVGGAVVPGSSVALYGTQQNTTGPNTIGQTSVALDTSNGRDAVESSPPPTYLSWMNPSDCTANNAQIRALAVTGPDASGVVRYVVTCAQSNAASLWLGTSDATAPPTMVATGMTTDQLMKPSLYAYVANEHFVVFKGASDFSTQAFGYGVTPAALGAMQPQPFNLVANQIAQTFAVIPTVAGDALTFFMASIDPGLQSASVWTGIVSPSGYATLGQTSQALKQIFSTTSVAGVGFSNNINTDAKSVYLGGASVDGTNVQFSWTRRDGTPLVLQQTLHTTKNATCSLASNCNTVLTAAAAPLGMSTLVVWVEQTAATPPQTSVYAVRLLCTGD
jgi:hypothetical protein